MADESKAGSFLSLNWVRREDVTLMQRAMFAVSQMNYTGTFFPLNPSFQAPLDGISIFWGLVCLSGGRIGSFRGPFLSGLMIQMESAKSVPLRMDQSSSSAVSLGPCGPGAGPAPPLPCSLALGDRCASPNRWHRPHTMIAICNRWIRRGLANVYAVR